MTREDRNLGIAAAVRELLAKESKLPVESLTDDLPLRRIRDPALGLINIENQVSRTIGICPSASMGISLFDASGFDWGDNTLSGLLQFVELVDRVADVLCDQARMHRGSIRADDSPRVFFTVVTMVPFIAALCDKFGVETYSSDDLRTVGSLIRHLHGRLRPRKIASEAAPEEQLTRQNVRIWVARVLLQERDGLRNDELPGLDVSEFRYGRNGRIDENR